MRLYLVCILGNVVEPRFIFRCLGLYTRKAA